MKIVAIGGVPATGKTTLMREYLNHLGPLATFTHNKVKGLYSIQKNIYILGIYESGETFAGTDKLSMTVIVDAKEFVSKMKDMDCTIVFEGDRLFNSKFLSFCKEHAKTEIMVLAAKDVCLEERYLKRGSNQNKTWLQGRKTKVLNIVKNFIVDFCPNETEQDKQENLSKLLKKTGLIV